MSLDVWDRVGAFHDGVVGFWHREVGEGVGGAGGREYADGCVDVGAVGRVCGVGSGGEGFWRGMASRAF